VTQVLVQYGADPHLQCLEAGQLVPPTALEIARGSNDKELINLLSTGAG
jgi:hypothetical protein